jgi:hypothetical protein
MIKNKGDDSLTISIERTMTFYVQEELDEGQRELLSDSPSGRKRSSGGIGHQNMATPSERNVEIWSILVNILLGS